MIGRCPTLRSTQAPAPLGPLRRAAAWLAIVAVLSMLAPPSKAGDSRTDADVTSPVSETTLEDGAIPRFAEIEPGLARGGQPTEQGFRFLRARGYRTVVSFRRSSDERRVVEEMGIHYVHIPMRAGLFGSIAPTKEDVARFLSVVSDSSQRPVFIHCLRGKDRTGTMAAIYRIESGGWTNEEARREMLSFGFNRYYGNLMQYVRTYTRGGAAVPAVR